MPRISWLGHGDAFEPFCCSSFINLKSSSDENCTLVAGAGFLPLPSQNLPYFVLDFILIDKSIMGWDLDVPRATQQ